MKVISHQVYNIHILSQLAHVISRVNRRLSRRHSDGQNESVRLESIVKLLQKSRVILFVCRIARLSVTVTDGML